MHMVAGIVICMCFLVFFNLNVGLFNYSFNKFEVILYHIPLSNLMMINLQLFQNKDDKAMTRNRFNRFPHPAPDNKRERNAYN